MEKDFDNNRVCSEDDFDYDSDEVLEKNDISQSIRDQYEIPTGSSSRLRRDEAMDSLSHSVKYKGKRISKLDREDLFDSTFDLKDFARNNDENFDETETESESFDEEEQEPMNDDNDDNSGSDSEDFVNAALKEIENDDSQGLQIMSATAERDAEIGKGVKVQQTIYDEILHLIINMQKPLQASYACFNDDRLKWDSVSENFKFLTSQEVKSSLKHLLQLESILSPSLFKTDSKKRKIDEEESCPFWKRLKARNVSLLPRLDSVLDEWNSKVQIRSSLNADRKLKVVNQSMSKQIKTVLEDKQRLIERTQVIRKVEKEYGNANAKSASETSLDPERFDGSDFYQHLLKEFISSRMKNSDDAMAVHLRYQAMKAASQKRRNVDTKASKGRKIRYEVHQKIAGFMAPIPVEPETFDPIRGITVWSNFKIDALLESIKQSCCR